MINLKFAYELNGNKERPTKGRKTRENKKLTKEIEVNSKR